MKRITTTLYAGIITYILIASIVFSATGTINHDKTYISTLDNPTWEWAESGGGFSVDYGHDVAVDNSGNVYIIGKYHAIGTFGNTTLTSYGPTDSWDIYVAKLDADGNWLWAIGAGGRLTDEGLSIDVDTISKSVSSMNLTVFVNPFNASTKVIFSVIVKSLFIRV